MSRYHAPKFNPNLESLEDRFCKSASAMMPTQLVEATTDETVAYECATPHAISVVEGREPNVQAADGFWMGEAEQNTVATPHAVSVIERREP